ncbi:hypothetical protein AQUSIP_10870 [Aquicella siphonis]|uniref:Uncharacterized protein n=1 Tax=Aquicella siphonis TaxID=254247 RepID=A0A5E4PFM7_9COXI|nr:hypothetical protein [Aquicella siphonis]VVC75790.1 hypothetical protein AQUSIP_10870 [Aquicella siphonis]
MIANRKDPLESEDRNTSPSSPAARFDASTCFIHDFLRKNSVPPVITAAAIEESLVALNRNNKLFGSFGETLVIFHNDMTPLGAFIRAIQSALTACYGVAVQDSQAGIFLDQSGRKAGPTAFAPIPNPHTTIIAMRVIDAYDEISWDKSLIQSYLYAKFSQYQPGIDEQDIVSEDKSLILREFELDTVLNRLPEKLVRNVLGIPDPSVNLHEFILLQSHLPLIYPRLESAIIHQTRVDHSIQLSIESLSLNANGSLGIKWKRNDELVALRKALSGLGGIAKHGDDIITTTVGYFPYCTETWRLEIANTLERILMDFKTTRNMPEISCTINLHETQLVKFTRNDLHPDYILSQPFISGEHLSNEINRVDFPALHPHADTRMNTAAQVDSEHDDTSLRPLKI